MVRNLAGQVQGAQMVNATTGAAFAGTVTVYITGDGGVQTIGSVGSGVCTAEGNGYYTYFPSATETDFALIAFTFIGSGAIPATIQVAPITAAQVVSLSSSSSSTAISASDLVTAAIQRVTSGGERPGPDDIQMGLARLNDLIDAWKIEGLTVYTRARTPWSITTASSYTVGATGTIAIDRPVNADLLEFRISDASVSPAYEYLVSNYTEDQYRAIAQKAMTATRPYGFYYNPTVPTGTLIPWPVPTGSQLSGVIYAQAPAGELGLSDTIVLPQGYRRFYRDNLAVELAPDFDLQPSQVLIQSAIDSKASVKKSNVRLTELVSGYPVAKSLGYSIYSGA